MYNKKQAEDLVASLASSDLDISFEKGRLTESYRVNSDDIRNLLDKAYEAGVAQVDHTGIAKNPLLIDKVADGKMLI